MVCYGISGVVNYPLRLALARPVLTWRTWRMADEFVTQGFNIIAITIHGYKNQ